MVSSRRDSTKSSSGRLPDANRVKVPKFLSFSKKYQDDVMADPGDDLKKVLKFRDQIIAEKKLYYQEFSAVEDMQGLAREMYFPNS